MSASPLSISKTSFCLASRRLARYVSSETRPLLAFRCNQYFIQDAPTRKYASKPEKSAVVRSKDQAHLPSVNVTFEKVKETTKTASYLGVILAGVGVTAIMFYAVFRELFSDKSPNGVYSKAFKRCLGESRVVDALGEPIKGYGEETRRGRRRHGSRRKGTVHLEVKENASGEFEYNYMFIELEGYPMQTIVVEDIRQKELAPVQPPEPFL